MQARSLFTKIFLWFWLAIILVAVAAIISGAWIRPYSDTSEEHARHFARMLQGMPARMTADVWKRGGQQALRDQLDLWKRHTGMEGFFFNPKAEELAGQTVPPGVRSLAEKAIASHSVEVQKLGETMYAASPVTGEQGQAYVYVSAVPSLPSLGAMRGPTSPPNHPGPPSGTPGSPDRPGPPSEVSDSPDRAGPPSRLVGPHDSFRLPPPLGFLLEQPERLALALIAVIITGGAVCYWLARTLTNPLAKLRDATTRLADGDLSVRVGKPLINRHDEIGELGRDFDRMAERLDSLLSTERRLLRDISHELRSPLARVNVALGIARQHATPATGGPLDRIDSEAERLNDLIGQLLTLARLEGGIEKPLEHPVDLSELVRQIVSDADFEARGRDSHVRLPHLAPCATIGNRELLRRAIENVIRNGIRYTADATDVEVTLDRQSTATGPTALIRVRDHGPGLPTGELVEVFRPFYRVDDGRDRDTGGVGLGLAIADRAVRAHGGTITAANAPDGGLIVEITLPLNEATPASPNMDARE